ncbi:MAG TPA: multidrug/biocide efflux PACE transporter [Candidatus Ignatzschineria merdigallinarum]|uniref:Multidrug/biocide efflux PACE transporter n=1 Tax=Candidatus Ignatzschineria merdigallinarum TaxID=2838621 RepID=A0A9D1TUI5_9GAMM|nr:multidrug/biocide efflux PACE transporter [Candidatus Ignatzschineria merdigallinarum]
MKITPYPQNDIVQQHSSLPIYDSTNRSSKERVFHAILFETIALLICAPLFAFLLNRSISEMGLMTFIIATIAVMWNFIYNILFDRITRSFLKERGFVVRVIHALIFELGLIVITVPIIASLLNITMWTAFLMDIGILLFFLPYTVIFNWSYDAIRKVLWFRKMVKER